MEQGGLTWIAFEAGPLRVTGAVVMTWLVMALLTGASALVTRSLRSRPGLVQTFAEGVVLAIENAIRAVMPEHTGLVLPFVGTLWMFLAAANLASLVPLLSSPTADLSVTAALAVLVFFSVHWFGIRASGLRAYLRHYVSPSPLLLPFHVIGELTRTLALAVRLFGNMMSMDMAAVLVLSVAGLLVPLPILMLHIVEALVQAYIFGILALVYIGGGVLTQRQIIAARKAP
jgi:F-type H+-transporting ATPase subunit a